MTNQRDDEWTTFVIPTDTSKPRPVYLNIAPTKEQRDHFERIALDMGLKDGGLYVVRPKDSFDWSRELTLDDVVVELADEGAE